MIFWKNKIVTKAVVAAIEERKELPSGCQMQSILLTDGAGERARHLYVTFFWEKCALLDPLCVGDEVECEVYVRSELSHSGLYWNTRLQGANITKTDPAPTEEV